MAYTITSESYGRRLPKITATADSTDDLATLGIDWAEGSSCVIGGKTYTLDKVQGWIEAGSGGGGNPLIVNVTVEGEKATFDKTWKEIHDAFIAGTAVITYERKTIGAYTGEAYTQIIAATHNPGTELYVVTDGYNTDYIATSENGYPSAEAD